MKSGKSRLLQTFSKHPLGLKLICIGYCLVGLLGSIFFLIPAIIYSISSVINLRFVDIITKVVTPFYFVLGLLYALMATSGFMLLRKKKLGRALALWFAPLFMLLVWLMLEHYWEGYVSGQWRAVNGRAIDKATLVTFKQVFLFFILSISAFIIAYLRMPSIKQYIGIQKSCIPSC